MWLPTVLQADDQPLDDLRATEALGGEHEDLSFSWCHSATALAPGRGPVHLPFRDPETSRRTPSVKWLGWKGLTSNRPPREAGPAERSRSSAFSPETRMTGQSAPSSSWSSRHDSSPLMSRVDVGDHERRPLPTGDRDRLGTGGRLDSGQGHPLQRGHDEAAGIGSSSTTNLGRDSQLRVPRHHQVPPNRDR